MVADMEVDMVADIVADMEVDMLANMEMDTILTEVHNFDHPPTPRHLGDENSDF